MPDTPSQSSEPVTALGLLRKFLKLHQIEIRVMPLKTWHDDSGRLIIDPPQVAVEYVKEPEVADPQANKK